MTGSAGRLVAITHVPSPHLEGGERTYVGHEPIDAQRALQQHAEYCDALRQCGAEVVTLDLYREYPDCVFVEDTAIVLDEVAVLMSMGAPSRRGEVAGIETGAARLSAARARPSAGDDRRWRHRSVGTVAVRRRIAAHECGGDQRTARSRTAVRLQRDGDPGSGMSASQDRVQRAARRALSRQLELDRCVAATGRIDGRGPGE